MMRCSQSKAGVASADIWDHYSYSSEYWKGDKILGYSSINHANK
jgi:hypothetical protein